MEHWEIALEAMNGFTEDIEPKETNKTHEEKLFGNIKDEALKDFCIHIAHEGENHVSKLLKSESKEQRNRNIMHRYLPRDFNGKQWALIVERFDLHCAVTESKEFEVEHFLPLSIGHGGTNFANLYPLDKSLNRSKRAMNPFIWVEKHRDEIDEERWNQLVFYLAVQNDLTVIEFKEFVFWCFDNQRMVAEVVKDRRPSIEIWRESK